MKREEFKRYIIYLGIGIFVITLVSVFIGRYPKPPWMPLSLLRTDNLARQLVLNLRLPRILVALLLGHGAICCGYSSANGLPESSG